MDYSMHCPVKGCKHVMEVSAKNEDTAVAELMKSGNEHFAKAKHEMDAFMTPEMQEKMTRQYMKKDEKNKKAA